MYIWYELKPNMYVGRTSRISVQSFEDMWNPRMSESVWMVPGTVDPKKD